MTDCDNLLRRFVDPETQQRFFQDPDGVAGLYQFTSKTSHHVYVAIDPTKTPELEQRGVVVLVTGAGRGIGREVAVYFAKAKAKAVIICARTLSWLEETGTEMYKVNPETEVLMQQVDVTSEKDVKSLFDAANDRYGTVRVAVSNAGRNGEPKLLADSDTESWWNDYETNVKGLYLIAKYFIKNLGEKTGTLVNMSSTNSLSVIPTQSAYGSSKNAANRLIEQLHWEYPHVRCFSLHPGLVDTEMSRTFEISTRYAWEMDSPDLAAGTALYLTTSRADFLRGRWISANWMVDELEQRKEQIVGQNLLKSALNAKLGPGGHGFE